MLPVDTVQLIFEDLIRRAVAQDLARQAITPNFDIGSFFHIEVSDSLSLGDESSDNAVVTLVCPFLTGCVWMCEIKPVSPTVPRALRALKTLNRCLL